MVSQIKTPTPIISKPGMGINAITNGRNYAQVRIIKVCVRNGLGVLAWPTIRPEIMGHKLQHFMPVLCVRLSCYWLSFNNAFTEKLVLNADLWVCIFWQRLNESNTSRLEMTFKFYSLLYVARPMRTHVLFFFSCLLAPRVVYCYNKGFGNLRSN